MIIQQGIIGLSLCVNIIVIDNYTDYTVVQLLHRVTIVTGHTTEWTEWSGNCYRLYVLSDGSAMAYNDAHTWCTADGGYLAVIESETENNFITSQ